jgi:protein-tyrosine phosphatase
MVDNFSWVIPGFLAGSALPGNRWVGSAETLRSDLADLHDRGVRMLVSLLEVSEAFPGFCHALGIRWLSHPIANFDIPADERAFDAVIEAALASLERRRPVCFHCFAGVGRTGLALCCTVGRRLGLAGPEAIRTVRSVREALETHEQERFVHRYLARVLRRA